MTFDDLITADAFTVPDSEERPPRFSAERVAIVSDVSTRLLADRSIVDRPAMAYFAHCPSPHKLFIVGDPAEHGRIVATLAGAVRDEASRRGVDIPPSHTLRKITEAFVLAGSTGGASIPFLGGNLTAVILAERRTAEDRLGGGYLTVEFVDRLVDLADQVGQKHQTLTHYGFSKEDLSEFARRTSLHGLSRIVPVGQALDFDAVWDGYDLLRELTRTMRLC